MRDNILVTGGCGFVGRNLVRALIRLKGPEAMLWLVDDLSIGQEPSRWLPADYKAQAHETRFVAAGCPAVVFIKDDVRRFLADHVGGVSVCGPELPLSFDDVFHFAAIVGGRMMIEGDPLAVARDLAIDAEFFGWAANTRPRRILYPSSSAAYPIRLQAQAGAVALKEEHITFGSDLGGPDMTYGWSKLTGEYLARLAASHYGLHVACVRPFSGYGEDQDESYPVPAIARRAAAHEDPLVVWGSGKQGRDFVHIDDCVSAMLLALERISDGSAVNIGSGRLTNFLEVAAMCAKAAGYSPRIMPLDDKPVGVHARYADTMKAEQVLGWKPTVALEEGLARVVTAACSSLQQRI